VSLSASPRPVTPRDYVLAQFRDAFSRVEVLRETAPVHVRWTIVPWIDSRAHIGQGETEELAWLSAMRWIRSAGGDE
jgi:hypothetical protein